RIVANPTEHHLREELIEDLKQVLLRFYPSRDWGQLRGEERRQRRRAIQLLFGTTLVFLTLAFYANYEQLVAVSRELSARAEALAATALLNKTNRPDLAALLSQEGRRMADLFEARNALLMSLQANPGLVSTLYGAYVAFSPDGKLLASANSDG